MLNPRYPAAVVAGNVETSQVVTDCLYGALGVLAASQGTMNNFTFGDGAHQYYETIAGGSGAGPDFDGAERRADAHDEFAADRSGSARVALSGAARGVSRSVAARGGAGAIAAATASSVACASCEPMTAVLLAESSRRRAVRPRRRRPRRDRPELDRARRRQHRGVRRDAFGADGRGRRVRDPDAGRRRLWLSGRARPPGDREHRRHDARVLRLRGLQHARGAGFQPAVLSRRSIR